MGNADSVTAASRTVSDRDDAEEDKDDVDDVEDEDEKGEQPSDADDDMSGFVFNSWQPNVTEDVIGSNDGP